VTTTRFTSNSIKCRFFSKLAWASRNTVHLKV
jgi:hypothetical protein